MQVKHVVKVGSIRQNSFVYAVERLCFFSREEESF
jgi:hypothetical protein